MRDCDCSIIILAHNGVEFTARCLQSLEASPDRPRELFVVDNGSTDGTPEFLAECAPRLERAGLRLTTWRNAENKGCSAARNEAWARASSTYVGFMDNDAAVCSRHWLSHLIAVMSAQPRVGIAGPKMIYPYMPHCIQCAGVSISKLGRICFRGRGQPRHEPRFEVRRSVPALISACWIMRNSLRDDVGYLDELFHPVQYEDLDLCLRARQAGYEIQYEPQVEIYHFEGITTASFGQQEYQRNIARNSAKFRERWHQAFRELEDDTPPAEYRWLARSELGLTPELDLALCGD